MRFTAQQHHDMTRLLRRKASKTPESESLRRKAIGFLALAKTAHKQATAAAATPPGAALPSIPVGA
jgi:hypothetical protein